MNTGVDKNVSFSMTFCGCLNSVIEYIRNEEKLARSSHWDAIQTSLDRGPYRREHEIPRVDWRWKSIYESVRPRGFYLFRDLSLPTPAKRNQRSTPKRKKEREREKERERKIS